MIQTTQQLNWADSITGIWSRTQKVTDNQTLNTDVAVPLLQQMEVTKAYIPILSLLLTLLLKLVNATLVAQ
jgi:hypothetical protein